MCVIKFNSTEFNFKNNEDLLYKFDNVIDYNFEWYENQIKINNSEQSTNDILLDKQIYFIFDNAGNDALAHFIFESFIFYNIFFDLSKIYNNIKIVTKNKKKYRKNIFKLFNIENIVVENIENTNNICFFHPIISISHSNINLLLFEKYLVMFINKMKTFEYSTNINYNILYFPRNKKDNFFYNQTEIFGLDELENSLIEYGSTVIDTYVLNNIHIQTQLLFTHKIIIVDYGSSLFFNCIFLTNKIIIVLNNREWFQTQIILPGYSYLFDIINKNNKVYVINKNNENLISFNDIKHLL
jgi:capsular polysaccharide biosynthesis protein